MKPVQVFVGLGSNEDREANLAFAVSLLDRAFGPLVLSPVYESADTRFYGPAFYNLVAGFEARHEPWSLRAGFREIEAHCGRVARRERTFPLDLDLLLYGHETHADPRLPHPDVLTRAFVLKPLVDLVPDWIHPQTGHALAWHWKQFESEAEHALARVAWMPVPGAPGDGQ